MAETLSVVGVLVGAHSAPWGPFPDEKGGPPRSGISRKAWIVTGPYEPTEVHFRDPGQFGSIEAAAQFASVELVCELSAAGNKIRRNVIDITKITPAK